MKKFILILLTVFIFPFVIQAQWVARQSLNNNAQRTFATAFSVNGKAYVVGGQVNFVGLADVWEYDPILNSWTQKNPFPGGARGGAVAFGIGSKGYFMCGSNYVGQYFNDVWEYDPIADSWTQKNNFPGMEREEAIGFTIGNLGYCGTGYQEVAGPNSTFFVTYSDFYEYDPATDTWTTKALLPTPPRGWAVGVSAGGRGYVGLGGNSNQNGSYSDFYEYDPQADSWTAKAGFGAAAGDAMAFSLAQKVYVCGGINFGSLQMYSNMRSFDPATNTWSVEAVMPAGPTAGAVAVNIGNRAFVGTGYNAGFNEKNDWWEFTSATATLCQAPVAFSTATFATNGTAQCDGKIVISNISNGCAPYTCSISPGTGSITGSTGFTVSGLCAGNYSVSIKDANCCGITVSVCTIPGNLTQGIPFLNYETAVHIVPNPNHGKFNLSIASGVTEQNIQVINSLGQAVPVSIVHQADEFNISLLYPEPGVYVLQVFAKGVWTNTKIVVH